MKTIRGSLIVLVTSAAFAVAADSAPGGGFALQHENPVFHFETASLQSVADAMTVEPVAGETPLLSAALPRTERLRSRAWQLINPLAPANYGRHEKPDMAPVPRIFTDPVKHTAGMVLFRLSW